MTEKRFTIVNMGLDGRLIKEDGKIIELERVVDLLNENEQLRERLKEKDQLLQKTLTTNDNLQKRIMELEND